MPKVKVAVQFAATAIIYTPQKDQDEMLLSSFLYSSITVSGNISDKPKKRGSIFFQMKIQKKKWSDCLMQQFILNFNNRSGKCSKHVPGANMQAFNWLTMDVWAIIINNQW